MALTIATEGGGTVKLDRSKDGVTIDVQGTAVTLTDADVKAVIDFLTGDKKAKE